MIAQLSSSAFKIKKIYIPRLLFTSVFHLTHSICQFDQQTPNKMSYNRSSDMPASLVNTQYTGSAASNLPVNHVYHSHNRLDADGLSISPIQRLRLSFHLSPEYLAGNGAFVHCTGFWVCCGCGHLANEALSPERCAICGHFRCSAGCSSA